MVEKSEYESGVYGFSSTGNEETLNVISSIIVEPGDTVSKEVLWRIAPYEDDGDYYFIFEIEKILEREPDNSGTHKTMKSEKVLIHVNADHDLPTVISSTPSNGDTDVSPATSITIIFSKDMDISYTPYWPIDTDPYIYSGECKWISPTTIECIPGEGLQADTEYTISISTYSLNDKAGNYMEQEYEWSFTTRALSVNLLSTTVYHKEGGDYTYIYGEVENQEPFGIKDINVEITCYDISRNVVRTETAEVLGYGSIIKPSIVAPFSLSVGDKDGVIKSVEIKVIGTGTVEEPYEGVVVISSQESYNSSFGSDSYSISGEVKNRGEQQTDSVHIYATFYDSTGKLVGVGYTYTSPSDIGIGQTSDFEITIYDNQCDVANINSYKLIIVAKSYDYD